MHQRAHSRHQMRPRTWHQVTCTCPHPCCSLFRRGNRSAAFFYHPVVPLGLFSPTWLAVARSFFFAGNGYPVSKLHGALSPCNLQRPDGLCTQHRGAWKGKHLCPSLQYTSLQRNLLRFHQWGPDQVMAGFLDVLH